MLCAPQVVGFVPTGWMYEMKRKAFPVREKGSCFIHLVPYSEHSSYSELREYVRFLRPHKVHTHSMLLLHGRHNNACYALHICDAVVCHPAETNAACSSMTCTGYMLSLSITMELPILWICKPVEA